jgi:hypothetical protein
LERSSSDLSATVFARALFGFAAGLLCMALPSAIWRCAEPPAEPGASFSDQLGGKAPDSITGNPAAENELPGTGLAGRLLHLPENSGLRLGGLWKKMQSSRFVPLLLAQPPRLFVASFLKHPTTLFQREANCRWSIRHWPIQKY